MIVHNIVIFGLTMLVIALAWSNLQGQFMCVRAINREIENQKLKQELLKH